MTHRPALVSDALADPFLEPGEVATLLDVDLETVSRWTRHGQLRAAVRTPDGHHRYRQSDVDHLLLGQDAETRPAA